ncbi:MAG: hypothetical protein K9H64_05750 [Bacteroidales bacterium]|nr:hypothetical protein [Bacteroidales bacterium]MCF8458547.1 hypothetical protein [Bacteroidales bacterium]
MGFDSFTVPTMLGLIGVALILLAYLLLQLEKLPSTSCIFLGMNILGSAFILVSLYFDFNLPSAIIELAWLIISLIGLIRIQQKKHKSK